MPLSPKIVFNPSGKVLISSVREASKIALSTSSSEASGLPKVIFCFKLSEKRKTSCGTYPICSRNLPRFKSLTGTPSNKISPSDTSFILSNNSAKEDFPDPVLPIMAIFSPALIWSCMFFRAQMPVSG